MGDRRGLILAVSALVVAVGVLLVSTGPNPTEQASSYVRRYGGACLQLDQWGLTGWRIVGQSHTVADIRDGIWHEATESPPCAPGLDQQIYLIRPPLDAPNGVYRIRGLDDAEPDLEFRRVAFEPGPPGP